MHFFTSLGLILISCFTAIVHASPPSGTLFTVEAINNGAGFGITTTVPNKRYSCAGILVAGQGVALLNTDQTCQSVVNGFCRFSISANESKQFTHSTVAQPTTVQVTICLNVCGTAPVSCERHQLELSYPAINPLVAVGSFENSALQTRYPLIYFSDTNGWQTITNTTASADDGDDLLEQSSSDVTSASLTAVSCDFSNSPANCVAIGTATTSSGLLPYAETSSDSGQTWASSPTQPELPANSTLQQFNGLACTSNYCVSVGSYITSDNNYSQPISYNSTDDGDNWVTPSTSFTLNGAFTISSASIQLLGVACASTNCVAVGSINTLPLSFTTTTSATSWGTPTSLFTEPTDFQSGSLSAVACDTTTAQTCFAVGTYYSTSNQPLAYSTTNGGTSWTLVNSLPLPSGASGGSLFHISCNSNATACVAVGQYLDTSNQNHPLVYTYNAGTWSLSANQPETTTPANLTGIACDSTNATACTAVGYSATNPINPLTFTTSDINTTAWSNTSPATSSGSDSVLTALSCNATVSSCVIVGDFLSPSEETGIVYSSSDSGATTEETTISVSSIASSESELPPFLSVSFSELDNFLTLSVTASELNAVSCGVTTNGSICSAVGNYFNNLGPNGYPLGEYSNNSGLSWSQVTLPAVVDNVSIAARLNSIGCALADCVSVGQYATSGTNNLPLIYYSSTGGESWLVSSAALPNGQTIGVLQGVVCYPSLSNNAVLCVAAGYSSATNDGTQLPLITTSANAGATWATGINLSLPAGAQSALLNALHCVPLTNTCFAVGSYANSSAIDVPLIYQSTNGGSSWSAQPPLPTVGTGSAQLNAIRCNTTGEKCYAVGYLTAETQQPLVYYSQDGGTTWVLASISSNANATVLTSLTCEPTGVTCVTSGYADSDARRPVRYLSSDSGLTWTTLPSLPELSSWLSNIINGSN